MSSDFSRGAAPTMAGTTVNANASQAHRRIIGATSRGHINPQLARASDTRIADREDGCFLYPNNGLRRDARVNPLLAKTFMPRHALIARKRLGCRVGMPV